MAISSAGFSGSKLVIHANNNNTHVELHQVGQTLQVRDHSAGGVLRNYARSAVNLVQFVGGNGHDRFVNYVQNLNIQAWGQGGHDYLQGSYGHDYLNGGSGNDWLYGLGGNDILVGGSDHDSVFGGAGNDKLYGEGGHDYVNGGSGTDEMYGGSGNDLFVAIDNGYTDYVHAGTGYNTIWIDRGTQYRDGLAINSTDKLHEVVFFANGADRTLNGDNIADPLPLSSNHVLKRFNGPLFSANGVSINDIKQGAVGDCYFHAGIGAIAQHQPGRISQNIVDFGDRTFGVRFGSSFYRVDADLYVSSAASTTPAYANLGVGNSLWVAIAEKAYAHHRYGQHRYSSLNGGTPTEVFVAFGLTNSAFQKPTSAIAMVNQIIAQWNGGRAIAVSTPASVYAGSPLVASHVYVVAGFVKNASNAVTGIIVRNPWNSASPFTVSVTTLFNSSSWIYWCKA